MQSVKLLCRKPTLQELADHEAKRRREIWRTGVMDGLIPVIRKTYIRRLHFGRQPDPLESLEQGGPGSS